MNEEPQIQGKFYRKFSSTIKTIKIHLANFAYNHKDAPGKDDIYIHRELLESKLRGWLTSTTKYGSYLVAGYRGMGKSSLVNHVLDQITREKNTKIESTYRWSVVSIFLFAFLLLMQLPIWALFCAIIFLCFAVQVVYYRYMYDLTIEPGIRNFPNSEHFSLKLLRRFLHMQDRHQKRYNRIHIKINLGREVMNERDVLCLITNHIRIRYDEYIHTGQNKPLWRYLRFFVCCMLAGGAVHHVVYPIYDTIIKQVEPNPFEKFFLMDLWNNMFTFFKEQHILLFSFIAKIVAFWLCYLLIDFLFGKIVAWFDKSARCLRQLRNLSDRLSSATSEAGGNFPNLTNSFLNLSFFGRKHKETPIANVRDIETELTEIINTINSKECIPDNRVQFVIVLDELDKVEPRAEKNVGKPCDEELAPPDFSTAVDGFAGSMTNTDRRKTILQLLANMKLFLTSARAKFIFISGRELYEAFLADLSDREYAISSIFSGVINVNSFLYPEREQSDISSMTEQYLAEILLPKNYLWEQTLKNARENRVLKREIPSLRWYTQYLTELAQEQGIYDKTRLMEIRHVVMFLRCFSVYLSHVSNGSPKKIVLYFEKYVTRYADNLRTTDWNDTLEYGTPYRYVLCFSPQDQQKIGFIFHLAAPIMDVITNNVSNYGDKLLIAASFIVDHLFKFHGRGFSWRNIEQTPELLDANKTSELRDFITSIVEFMQQIHLSTIMVGLFQFKFRKRISEEISYISRISDEAAAMFNFTLNESQAVKQYNVKLLNYYLALNKTVGADGTIYNDAIARIHVTLADLYFQEEDYSRAIQEYRNALSFLDRTVKQTGKETPSSLITRIRCMLKMGLTCEYRKTYDTAYIIYCRLIDAMISVREVDERELGVDLIDSWTDDWRVKQPMIVDYGVRRKDDEKRRESVGLKPRTYDQYRDQFIGGIWNEGPQTTDASSYHESNSNKSYYDPAEYSLDFDKMVSGFAKNLSPEKSRFVMNLSLFEDVRLIYKAILAKLFVIEKMNMSGITKSNIDIAEAEFKYLHRTINLEEKFFISADFFNQLGKILYYKNSLGLLIGTSTDLKNESLYVALYWWNIDIYAYLDDFCFKICNPQNATGERKDAVKVKKSIRDFFDNLKWNKLFPEGPDPSSGSDREKLIDAIRKEIKNNGDEGKVLENYLDYMKSHLGKTLSLGKITECSEDRCSMCEKGWHLPCFACKYYNQSLRILMDRMFIDASSDEMAKQYRSGTKSWFVLRYSFRKYLRYMRVNHLCLLATNIMSMGNTMFSCAKEKLVSAEVLSLANDVLASGPDDYKETVIGKFKAANLRLSKLDKAIMYYLAAYRYYNIAYQYKDAGDSLFRILRLINELVTVYNFDKKSKDKNGDCISVAEKKHLGACIPILFGTGNLLEKLFTRYAKSVSAQYGYSSIPEMCDYKWIFQMNDSEDVNLERLQTYSELKEVIWLIADIRIKLLNIRSFYLARREPFGEEFDTYAGVKAAFKQEIIRIYKHFNTLSRVSDTFYNSVITHYAKFRLNKWILKDMLGGDPMIKPEDSHKYDPNFVVIFLKKLEKYLTNPIDDRRLDVCIFEVQDTLSDKLQLVEFILEDSIACLTEILYILTPYNHISSFSNSFVAEVYSQLWENAKLYETLVQMYDYKNYCNKIRIDEVFKIWESWELGDMKGVMDAIKSCSRYVVDDVDMRARYGSLHDRFFLRIRHHIDDRTVHHIFSNYAMEMALRYYTLAETSHSEGNAYKNQINRNYILNDDLDNDTWLFNTTLERFRLHTSYIQYHRRRLVELYAGSRFYKNESYFGELESKYVPIFDPIRFEDSLYTNSEL